MVVRTSRRLPGFRFEVQPPPLTDVLPRMDVAVFVGFAASGPLQTPVPVEDVAQFTAIFGDDVPLAWDQQRGEIVYAYLAPAVRAFFRNGGRRCWVVRVAGNAQSNYFPIPGLAQVRLDNDRNIVVRPAFARARSEGSWSDSLRVGAALLSRSYTVEQFSLENQNINLTLISPNTSNDIVVGDLLRLAFQYQHQGYVLMFVVQSVQSLTSDNASALSETNTSPESRLLKRRVVRVQVKGNTPAWFSTVPVTSPPTVPTQATMFTHDCDSPPISVHNWSIRDGNSAQQVQTVQCELTLPSAQAPTPGSFLRLDFETGQFWLTVQELTVVSENELGSPPVETVEVTGQGLLQLKDAPPPQLISTLNLTIVDCERLNFELWVKQSDSYPVRLSKLAFEAHHPYFCDALPTDAQLYQDESGNVINQGGRDLRHLYGALWEAAATPRFPLAGRNAANTFYIPIVMPILPDQFLGPDKLSGTELDRDGLCEFEASLFLDPDLLESHTMDLMVQADFLRYQSSSPRPLLPGLRPATNSTTSA